MEQKLTKAQNSKLGRFTTTSARIRYLHSIGWKNGPIAKKLGKRFQHVRGVLVTPVKNPIEKI